MKIRSNPMGWICAYGRPLAVLLGLMVLPSMPVLAGKQSSNQMPVRRPRLLLELEAVDRQLADAELALMRAGQARQASEGKLADAQSAQATAQLHHTDASHALGRRLGALIRQPAAARLALLGGSRSLGDFVDNERLMRAVAAHDRALWGAVVATRQQLDLTLREHEERRQTLTDVERRGRQLRDSLAIKRRERAELVAKFEQAQARRLALASEQQQARVNLHHLVATKVLPKHSIFGRANFSRNKGRLVWPAPGRVRVAFGQRAELTFGTATRHNGIDIAAPAGSSVRAVAEGKVAFSDWLHGYGQVVIIDHSDDYFAICAHLARRDVRAGERVLQGQLIGAVGDTGSMRGTVLYFEIRRQGVPVDPLNYLLKNR